MNTLPYAFPPGVLAVAFCTTQSKWWECPAWHGGVFSKDAKDPP